jgi:Glycoside hydrolase 131 catalytic N-terminal domain
MQLLGLMLILDQHPGSPFTNPTEPLPARKAEYLKVLDRDLNVVFEAKFIDDAWHNFAVIVDWDKKTLQAFYSQDQRTLLPVSKVVPNLSVKDGAAGRGEFHFGLLKVGYHFDPEAGLHLLMAFVYYL